MVLILSRDDYLEFDVEVNKDLNQKRSSSEMMETMMLQRCSWRGVV